MVKTQRKIEIINDCSAIVDYEDLEEQGLLVRLPCKVGDDLYCIVNGEVKKLKVHSFGVPDFEIIDIEFKYVDGFKIVRFVGEVGKTVGGDEEMNDKLTPEITPQLAVSAFSVLHQYCSSISPHDCIRCTFYEHCPECFMGCPGDQGEMIRKLQSNE